MLLDRAGGRLTAGTIESMTIHAYVDETGKDNRSKHFIVSVILIEQAAIESTKSLLAEIETESHKDTFKWTKSSLLRKIAFFEQVIECPQLHHIAFYKTDAPLTSELAQVCKAIVQAVVASGYIEQKISVHIDGKISRNEEATYKRCLRKYKVKVAKVKGVSKLSDDGILCRYADACCGLVRAYKENEEGVKKNTELAKLYRKAKNSFVLQAV